MESWIEYAGDEVVVNIKNMFTLLWKKIWVLVMAAVLGAAVLFSISNFLLTPMYEASVKMYVNNRSDKAENAETITSADITAAQNLVDTYKVVLTSKPTIQAVIKKTKVEYSYDDLVKMISAEAINNTEIFSVTVSSPSAQESALIANAIAEIAPDKIMDVISGSSVKIIESAEIPEEYSSPNIKKNTAIGCIAGFLLACFGVLLLSVLRNGMTAEEKIQKDFESTSVLAAIPEMGTRRKRKGKTERAKVCEDLDFATSEAYKLLRTNILFSFADGKASHVIGVTSSLGGEGKSTTSVNLAYTLAQAEKRVCLIDCDLRLPTVGKVLNLKSRPGLVNFLTGQEDALTCQKVKRNDVEFFVVTCGDIPPNPSEILSSSKLKATIQSLRGKFDYVILDLPPLQVVADALTVKDMVDGMIVVVNEMFYKRNMLNESLNMLSKVNAKLLGLVLTHSLTQKKAYGKYGQKYGYATENKIESKDQP